MQDFAGRFDHSSHQKPHFEQPPTISPKAMTLATMVSRLNTRSLMLRCDYRALNQGQRTAKPLTSRLGEDHAAANRRIKIEPAGDPGEDIMKRTMKRWGTAAAAAGLAFMLATAGASGAEITLLCSNALKSVIEELGPGFEKASGHQLKVEYGSTGPLKAAIEKGRAFDIAILGVDATEDLIKRGLLAAGSRADIARSGMGVAVRKGAAKPDLATAQAFKQVLLNAQTIAYSDGGLSGTYLKGLLERLGIAEQIKSKIRFGRGGEMVGEGKAEIGLTQVSEILSEPGAELAGPLPADIQQYTVFPAAIGAAAAHAEAAQALLKFLRSPEAAKVLKAKGLEPAGA